MYALTILFRGTYPYVRVIWSDFRIVSFFEGLTTLPLFVSSKEIQALKAENAALRQRLPSTTATRVRRRARRGTVLIIGDSNFTHRQWKVAPFFSIAGGGGNFLRLES